MNTRTVFARYACIVWFLLGLFSLRVIGQFIQLNYSVAFLPPLDQWQGSSIPYPLLLCFQIIIVILAVFVAVRIKGGRIVPHRKLGNILLSLGFIYFGVMLARLLLGLTLLSDHYWFNRSIPAFFHLILAGILLTLGDYHRRYGKVLS